MFIPLRGLGAGCCVLAQASSQIQVYSSSVLPKIWSFKISHYPGQVLLTLPDRNANGQANPHKQHLKPFCWLSCMFWLHLLLMMLAKTIWPCVTGRLRQGTLARMGRDGRIMKKNQHGNLTHPLLDFFSPYIFKYYVYIYFRPKHCLFFFFSFWAAPHNMQNLSSPTRDQTQALSSGNFQSQPLDCQGSPQNTVF